MKEITEKIKQEIQKNGIAILPPMEADQSLDLLKECGINVVTTILDPWYNKGIGGELPLDEYDLFISNLLIKSFEISDVVYLWGFPEIIGPFSRFKSSDFKMTSWLTWYYKNCPSVIRGWRSSQNACLQFTKNGYKLHPENFLTEEQLEKYHSGKMRFVPGPPSVIESPLIIGFVGKKEQTGHPAQKPEAVFDRILKMSQTSGDIVFDPMAGSGTTAAVATKNGYKAIVCDKNEEYIQLMEKRLGVSRIQLAS